MTYKKGTKPIFILVLCHIRKKKKKKTPDYFPTKLNQDTGNSLASTKNPMPSELDYAASPILS